ncbi:uncharacterized protein TNCV_2642581 [Trichonephila clavipes]|nr:uncharacterized protein TNCV_2642581 [Trichonephila clavipes]
MAGYHYLSEFERGVIVCAREMGQSIAEVTMKFRFLRARPYHECTVNIGNLVKHQIYDIVSAMKISYKKGRNKDSRESLIVTDVQHFRKLLQILQMSPCEPFNETSSISVFEADGPLVYPC